MSRLTAIREALHGLIPDELESRVLTGPQEGPTSFGGPQGQPTMVVRVLVGEPGPETEQKLDRLLDTDDPESIAKALTSDQKLGGLTKAVQVTKASGWQVYQQQEKPPVLGAEWTVQIY